MDDHQNGRTPNGRDPHQRRPPWEDWPHETADGAATDGGTFGPLATGQTRDAADDDDDDDDEEEQGDAAGWVSAGGVLEWTEPDETADPAAEVRSPLSDDDLTMPEGAPSAPRLRAVHAWLARRRLVAQDAIGGLLLAQRAQRQNADHEQQTPRRRRRTGSEASPLDLALAEHQAAADEYDMLLAALDDLVAHTGPHRALVEFYLWLGEHLAALAAEPDADNSGGPPAAPGTASWLGRAQAALATRTRVEQMTAPAQDD